MLLSDYDWAENGVLELDCADRIRDGELLETRSHITVDNATAVIASIHGALVGGGMSVPGGTLSLERSQRRGHAISWVMCEEGVLYMNSWGVRSTCRSLVEFSERHGYSKVYNITFLLFR